MVETASLDAFRAAAKQVSNWGRWGDQDQLGTLNFITPEKVKAASSLVRRGAVFSLGVDFDSKGPQGSLPFRTNVMHFMTIGGNYDRYSDEARATDNATAQFYKGVTDNGLFRFNDDFVMMPLQAATQWDSLAHAYYEGQMYNGVPSGMVTEFGAARLGIEVMGRHGVAGRGVLVDVVRHRGSGMLNVDEPVTGAELDEILAAQGVSTSPGDVLVVRTGWWENFKETGDRDALDGGLSWTCAEWLHDHSIAAVATDNVQVEPMGMIPEVQGVPLALHCLCLRDMGLPLGEMWNLAELAEDCATDGVYEFQLVAPPIRFSGGVGSPLNPIAIK